MRIENGLSVDNYSLSQNQKTKNEVPTETKQVDISIKQREIQFEETAVANEERRKTSEQDMIKAIEKANHHIKTYDRKLEFSIHQATKQIVVKVINTNDDTVIREIPSEKVLDLVAHMWEVAGILVDEKR